MNDSPHVLVVEDHTDISQLYRRLLSDVEITSASSGEQACDVLRGSAFDLVILDLHLGQVSGLDVLSLARSLPQHAATPIIVVSADDSLRREAREKGCSTWISKPFDIDRLIEVISTNIHPNRSN